VIKEPSREASAHVSSRGQFRNEMEYLTWGSGGKTALFLPAGPGSELPTGLLLRLFQRRFRPYVAAAFTVWILARRRNMPASHSVADGR
jgi:hypothetical protein